MRAATQRTVAKFLTGFRGRPGTLTHVSVGIGRTQRRALAVMAERWDGVSIVELADILGLTERRCRTMVAALVARGEAATAELGYVDGKRVWTPQGLTQAFDLWARSGFKRLPARRPPSA
jgi:hypothetical protein